MDNEVLETARGAVLVLDDGVVDTQCTFCHFQRRLAVDANGAVADDGMADAVVGTGASVKKQDLSPLSRRVVIIGLQTVALNDDGMISRAVDDQLAVTPCEDAAVLMAIHVRALFDA